MIALEIPYAVNTAHVTSRPNVAWRKYNRVETIRANFVCLITLADILATRGINHLLFHKDALQSMFILLKHEGMYHGIHSKGCVDFNQIHTSMT